MLKIGYQFENNEVSSLLPKDAVTGDFR